MEASAERASSSTMVGIGAVWSVEATSHQRATCRPATIRSRPFVPSSDAAARPADRSMVVAFGSFRRESDGEEDYPSRRAASSPHMRRYLAVTLVASCRAWFQVSISSAA